MKKILGRTYKYYGKLLIIFIAGVCFLIWQNNSIVISRINYSNSKISKEFNNFKIAHLSDLHNKSFGKGGKNIIDKLKNMKPDIIVITGDLIDRRKYNLNIAMELVDNAVKISPVYYVSGNHEAWSKKYEDIKGKLLSSGVKVVDNEVLKIYKGNSYINLMGLRDPDFLTSDYLEGTDVTEVEENLCKWKECEGFKVLLSHRPELLKLYKDYKIDLIFSGHAHGGQIRIPGVGGIVAPDQGLFPKYTSGIYKENHTSMVVSRGLGNSIFPFRIFNRPEIVEVTLKVQ
ncbi:hypothetical protein SAMN02745248_00314 [Hathewaya proteolytica DSM 3090]|uniref:Calcineurin-like phosphoesterase domain-containing protein n=1 Tax=Hathewaya proteolytica DSM 3090 TaxID=1121331 RepID=A0A1M6K2N2_9CLOT|nr:metallophosphoesterase [Hathewaya proteolytica]SHJ53177.1 hypothetical protein SAMN02745248_00314 [Hathewaya proteolytica DSM 3090]